MRWAKAVLAWALLCAAPALGEYVTDPEMCGRDPIETQEMGMRLDARAMWTIEYYCEWDGAVEFGTDVVQVRLGYCSEPGYLFPTLFAFVVGAEGPGTLSVYEGDAGEAQRFAVCPE